VFGVRRWFDGRPWRSERRGEYRSSIDVPEWARLRDMTTFEVNVEATVPGSVDDWLSAVLVAEFGCFGGGHDGFPVSVTDHVEADSVGDAALVVHDRVSALLPDGSVIIDTTVSG